jgi:hypothetical protein
LQRGSAGAEEERVECHSPARRQALCKEEREGTHDIAAT